MKTKNIFLTGILGASALLVSCSDFLEQSPKDSLTETTYFKNATQFQAAANYLHNNIYAWNGNTTYPLNFDYGSDVSLLTADEGSGNNVSSSTDVYWEQTYKWLRTVNQLLEKADEYADPDGIAGPIGQAYFFRAWHHFFLLKRFGGVPIATEVPTTDSEMIWGPRASRYQVMDQIISDLDKSIELLTKANVTAKSTSNDGHVTLEAAEALKARVCLFEGTWEKYVKTSTDGNGTSIGAGSEGYSAAKYTEYLQMARDMAKKVIDSGSFELWTGVESVASSIPAADRYSHTSYYYLFNLEDAQSNPVGLTKASNKEAIFRTVYDYTNRQGNTNLSNTKPATPSRKMMDMYLCTDGLPIQYSPLFKGYKKMSDEFQNRDYRLTSCVKIPFKCYWGWAKYSNGADYSVNLDQLSGSYIYVPDLRGGAGYSSRKFCSEHKNRSDYEESADYYQIRLSEIYLIYAEATCELGNGDISDTDLNYSINKVRARAGVAPLTHALIAPYPDLTLLGEIRRERALELLGEGQRILDLCRWNIAVDELSAKPICGTYITYEGENTEYKTAVSPIDGKPVFNVTSYDATKITSSDIVVSTYAGFAKTKAGAVISEKAGNRNFKIKNYIQPIPTTQITLNTDLLQNPGW